MWHKTKSRTLLLLTYSLPFPTTSHHLTNCYISLLSSIHRKLLTLHFDWVNIVTKLWQLGLILPGTWNSMYVLVALLNFIMYICMHVCIHKYICLCHLGCNALFQQRNITLKYYIVKQKTHTQPLPLENLWSSVKCTSKSARLEIITRDLIILVAGNHSALPCEPSHWEMEFT